MDGNKATNLKFINSIADKISKVNHTERDEFERFVEGRNKRLEDRDDIKKQLEQMKDLGTPLSLPS